MFALDAGRVLRRYRDLAMTALIMAQVPVDGTDCLAEVATAGVRPFLAHAGGEPRRVLDEVTATRTADPNLTPHEVRPLNPCRDNGRRRQVGRG
ncbi:MAG TPA: hypothetical protein VGJ07_26285 [Rugosimonospora sp.]